MGRIHQAKGRSKIILPWSRWLKFRAPRQPINTLVELEEVAATDKIAGFHLTFLQSSIEPLEKYALPQWRKVIALGPFSGMRHQKKSIPIIAVADYKKPFRHLYALSWSFARSFSEFGILPDIYILSESSRLYLLQIDHPMWSKTVRNSIELLGGVQHD